MLQRSDFGTAGQIELALAAVRAPGRVVGRRGEDWAVVLAHPAPPGVLSVLSAALAVVLGPVRLARAGRKLLVRRDSG